MVDNSTLPFAHTRMAKFLDKRITQLQNRKTQRQISVEAGFNRPNIMSMMKAGASRVPLDRVTLMAKALEVDVVYLFRLALEQQFGESQAGKELEHLFRNVVTDNETELIAVLHEISGDTDPEITNEMKEAVRKALSPFFVTTAA